MDTNLTISYDLPKRGGVSWSKIGNVSLPISQEVVYKALSKKFDTHIYNYCREAGTTADHPLPLVK